MSRYVRSEKQKFVLKWWNNPSFKYKDGIICDGAIRSGKTLCMSESFIMWAMSEFDGKCFAMCGKTIISLRRNVVDPLLPRIKDIGMSVREKISANYIDVTFGRRRNRFYLFGGRDESSAGLIQGMTLAGLLMDEVVLMPRSFVEQAVARCSEEGSKLWFNCNPDNPYHWFKKDWIDKAVSKGLIYIHFDLTDNPSLSTEIIKRYHRLYSGAFHRRFVLGKWAAAEGLVYPMFEPSINIFDGNIVCDRYVVSCDYGTVNPSSFGLWGRSAGVWYRLDEYYYDSRAAGKRKTDEEHYESLCRLIGDRNVDMIVCDPSAQSFIQCIQRHGKYSVLPANNDVIRGIRLVSDCIRLGKIRFSARCKDTIREFSLYRWDEKAGKDSPVKENDHAMDDIRYFVTAVLDQEEDDFFVISLDRDTAEE